ncbi:MAG: hypothetical protein WDO15_11395 [Bacteroidota bacterium]
MTTRRNNTIPTEHSVVNDEEGNAVTLPKDVAAKYKPRKGLVTKFFDPDFEHVDLSTITMERAAQLAEKGLLIEIKEEQSSSDQSGS